jgi:hypothetical protein
LELLANFWVLAISAGECQRERVRFMAEFSRQARAFSRKIGTPISRLPELSIIINSRGRLRLTLLAAAVSCC